MHGDELTEEISKFVNNEVKKLFSIYFRKNSKYYCATTKEYSDLINEWYIRPEDYSELIDHCDYLIEKGIYTEEEIGTRLQNIPQLIKSKLLMMVKNNLQPLGYKGTYLKDKHKKRIQYTWRAFRKAS